MVLTTTYTLNSSKQLQLPVQWNCKRKAVPWVNPRANRMFVAECLTSSGFIFLTSTSDGRCQILSLPPTIHRQCPNFTATDNNGPQIWIQCGLKALPDNPLFCLTSSGVMSTKAIGWTGWWSHGHLDGLMVRWTDGWKDSRMKGWMNGRMVR